MKLRSSISNLDATPIGRACRCRMMLAWVIAIFCWHTSVLAQDITVTDAVIHVPEGTILSTDGGITFQNEGAIENDGTIDLGGDWVNDGKGLLETGDGTVVFGGEEQAIGGTTLTSFHNLTLIGKGNKELATDIAVTGHLQLRNCALLLHGFAFSIDPQHPLNFLWENGMIVAEDVAVADLGEYQFAPSSPAGHHNIVLAASIGVTVPPTTSSRSKASQHSPSGNANCAMNAFLCHNAKCTLRQLLGGEELGQNGAIAARRTMYFASENGEYSSSAIGIEACGAATHNIEFHLHPRRGHQVSYLATASSLLG